jgi:hypothetical protein
MSSNFVRRTLLVLALSATLALAAVPLHARPIAGGPGGPAAVRAGHGGVVASLWNLFVGLWNGVGTTIDPNGGNGVGTTIDPNGGNGVGMTIDPNGNGVGTTIDPNGGNG